MFFRKKKDNFRCPHCNSSTNKKYTFCPYCGEYLLSEEEEARDFGMLGRKDLKEEEMLPQGFAQPNMGITDKILNSLINNLVKTLDKQFKELDKTEIKSFPNGIKIKIGPPQPISQKKSKVIKKEITDEQIQKMSGLPREAAKTNVRRLSNKVIYELNTPGVESTDDVFVSRLESGYEIKAIGKKKVYVNSLPISLPIKGFFLGDNKLLVEFHTQAPEE